MSTDNLPVPRFAMGDIQQMAQSVSRSRLFSLDEAQAVTLMLLAQAKGLHPIQAMERYHVIKGRPAMKAEAMLAEFQANGGRVEWHRHDHESCYATFEAPGVKTPTSVAWTLADAKRAGLTASDMYTKYPRQMLRARVISEGIRMTMPGIILGLYTPEEVADFEPVQRDAQVSPQLPSPNNNTGYGRGQYASPAQVEDFRKFMIQFIESRNAQWLDRWTSNGEVAEGIKDLLNPNQLTHHLLKWGLRTNRLAELPITFDSETGKPTEKVSTEQAKKYVAILYHRHQEALCEEAVGYFEDLAATATEAWQEKYGESQLESDELADLETTEAGTRG